MNIVALRSERPAFSFECGDDAFGGLGKWNVSSGTGDQDIEIQNSKGEFSEARVEKRKDKDNKMNKYEKRRRMNPIILLCLGTFIVEVP